MPSSAPIDPAELGARARRGVGLLLGRHVLVQGLSLASGIVVARAVTPAELGLFAAAAVIVGVAQVLADAGIAAALVQRDHAPTDGELRSALGTVLAIAAGLCALLALTAPWAARTIPGADGTTALLLRVLVVDLVLTAWRSVHGLTLERDLRFERLAPLEVVEQLVFAATVAGLAVSGHGAWSFVGATLARDAVGALLVTWAAPRWITPRLALRESAALLRAGRAFVVGNLVNGLSSWVTSFVVAWSVGPQGLGLVTWAAGQARRPLAVVNAVVRVAFPYFSRLQEDRAAVEAALSRALVVVFAGAGLWCTLMITTGEPLVRWAFTERWVPAVPALVLFSAAIALDATVWLSAAALSALGLAHLAPTRALLRMAAVVGLTVPLVALTGEVGAPLAYLLALTFTLPACFTGFAPGALRRVMAPTLWVVVPGLAGVGAGLLVRGLAWAPPAGPLAIAAVTTATFLGLAWPAAPAWLRAEVTQRLRRTPRKPDAAAVPPCS